MSDSTSYDRPKRVAKSCAAKLEISDDAKRDSIIKDESKIGRHEDAGINMDLHVCDSEELMRLSIRRQQDELLQMLM